MTVWPLFLNLGTRYWYMILVRYPWYACMEHGMERKPSIPRNARNAPAKPETRCWNKSVSPNLHLRIPFSQHPQPTTTTHSPQPHEHTWHTRPWSAQRHRYGTLHSRLPWTRLYALLVIGPQILSLVESEPTTNYKYQLVVEKKDCL